MLISGIQKFTLLDYPEKAACIIFTPGCNFRCGYCHNPEFVLPEQIKELRGSMIPDEAVFGFLEKRRGLLDGVVITGGEPTLMPDLKDFIIRVRDLGFLVKLDSNGNRPGVLEDLFKSNLLDYVAMDVKTSLPRYTELVGSQAKPEHIKKSMDIIRESGVDYEFRATLVREIHSDEVLSEMKELLQGSKRFFVQTFRSGKVLDPKFEEYHGFASGEMEEIATRFSEVVDEAGVR
ncbi:MAG: anaerobic ribonucleoside-triphosphate reductase activating protein [Candidatus Magasanikbacteria bacterium]